MRRNASGISCLLALDKPLGLSSHDVVNRVRRILGERRVGHAGTLDPDASGVLVVGVGLATRLLGMLTLDDKRYDARIVFGSETTTDDAEGDVIRTADVPERLREEAVAKVVVQSLVGTFEQVPPAFSAISVDGRRAYDRARSGEVVELPARSVTVYEAQLRSVQSDEPLTWDCTFHVSKGTYIRSIARDLGRSMGTAAHLCGLRRTASGPIDISQCLTLEALEELGPAHVAERALDPVAVLALAHHELNAYERDAVAVGKRFTCRSVIDTDGKVRPANEGERICLVSGNRLMGVWEVRDGRCSCVANFIEGVGGVRV